MEVVASTRSIGGVPNHVTPAEIVVCVGFQASEIERLVDRCGSTGIGMVILGEMAAAISIRSAAEEGGAALSDLAVGLLETRLDSNSLGTAIRAVSAGIAAGESDLLSRAFGGAHTPHDSGPSGSLTPRETEVLAVVAGGFSNSEIAGMLSITSNTVKFHISRIMAKLGAANRAEAVLRAIQSGELEA